MGHLISTTRSDDPCWMAEMGTRFTDMDCKEETHWKHSPVSLQYDAADVYYGNNLDMVLEATVQVSLVKTCLSLEMHNLCDLHKSKRHGVMDCNTLANC